MPTDSPAEPTTPGPEVAERLAAVLRIPTVTTGESRDGATEFFTDLHVAMERLWPSVFAALELERFGTSALLFRWPGADAEADPLVLMAHQDVVPVDGIPTPVTDTEATAPGWTSPPFSGTVRDGAVWGRGALDDKGALVCILDAVAALLADGFTPARDVYLAFGDDEESSRSSGAPAIAAELSRRGVTPWLVLDEGGAVVTGQLPGVAVPTAVIGVAEKGVTDLELTTTAPGGHASTPVRGGAVARLAQAITRIERRPFPARLTEPIIEMLEGAGQHATGPLAPVLRRARLLRRPLSRVLPRQNSSMNAMLRTTTAVTMLHGSPGRNVLATEAKAAVNVRVAVGETVEQMVDRLNAVIDDPQVELTVVSAHEPSPISPSHGPQWEALEAAIAASYPSALALPYIQTGASDSRFFTGLSANVYRFTPFLVTPSQLAGLHGIDENLSVTSLEAGVVFYRELIRTLP